MRAITIRQPWAWAIANGFKDIENRSWVTSYRGLLKIHAARGCTVAQYERAARFMEGLGITPPPLWELDMGGIVGRAKLVDVVSPGDSCESPWYTGRFGLVLCNARPLRFAPMRGQLGIWRI